MAITVYTYNDKVLKNVSTGKWLKEKEAPAGFVMDASNVVATSGSTNTYWEGPSYPDAWQGEGKTIKLTVSEDITMPQYYSSYRLCYASRSDGQEELIGVTDYISPTNNTVPAGTYTFTAQANSSYGMSHNYGKYICLNGISTSDVSKITIQILD